MYNYWRCCFQLTKYGTLSFRDKIQQTNHLISCSIWKLYKMEKTSWSCGYLYLVLKYWITSIKHLDRVMKEMRVFIDYIRNTVLPQFQEGHSKSRRLFCFDYKTYAGFSIWRNKIVSLKHCTTEIKKINKKMVLCNDIMTKSKKSGSIR